MKTLLLRVTALTLALGFLTIAACTKKQQDGSNVNEGAPAEEDMATEQMQDEQTDENTEGAPAESEAK